MFGLKKLDGYIIKKFLGSFFLVIFLIILVVIVIDISENIQDFLDGNAPLKDIIFGYYLNFVPYFVNMFSPLFTFVAVIYFTSKLSINSELIAMLNAGLSFYRIMVPYIISAFLIGMLSFYLTNFMIPHAARGMMEFKEKYVSRQVRSKDIDTHIKLNDSTYAYIHYWDNANNVGYNFWYEGFSDDGVKYKLRAQTIMWDTVKNDWILGGYSKRTINGRDEYIEEGAWTDTNLAVQVSDFVYVKEGINLMNFREIRDFIEEEKAKGSSMIKSYEFEKHRRLAFPFSTIILTVIGLCVSSRKSRQGMGLHLLLGLIIAFSFIMLMQVTQMFAIYGGFSPFWSAWTPNILFGALSVLLIKLTPK